MGHQKGFDEGIARGHRQGKQEGKQEGEAKAIRRVLVQMAYRHLGKPPLAIINKIVSADLMVLRRWLERIIKAEVPSKTFR